MKKIVVVIALVIIFYEQANAKEKQGKVTPEENIAALIEGAKNGNPNAMGLLGIGSLQGKHCENDEKEGIRLLTLAANAGDLNSQEFLGSIYLYPDTMLSEGGVEQDLKEAEKWMRAASEQGRHIGLALVGGGYANVKKYDQALQLFKDGAKLNDPRAQLYMGTSYREGWGVNIDHKEALKWYLKAAKNGETESQVRLGGIYTSGTGVVKNEEESMRWYLAAASQGDMYGQVNVALKFLAGSGGLKHRNPSKALKYLSLAAQQNSKRACIIIKRMQTNSDGPKEEILKALSYCS